MERDSDRLRWSLLRRVEAETGEDAIEQAMDGAGVNVCHQCANDVGDVELGRFVATCGDDVVEDEPALTWQEQAKAAGWTPPPKKRAAKREPAR